MVSSMPSVLPGRGRRGVPLACVIGDLSLVRALGCRGIPVAVATSDRRSSATKSRYCQTVVPVPSVVDDPAGAVRALVDWGKSQPEPPVVFYQGDHDLLALSRHRVELAGYLRCMLPPRELVEDCVDKVRFAAMAERLNLPVPKTFILRRGASQLPELLAWDHFPCVLKPAMRTHWFDSDLLLHAHSKPKALYVGCRADLERLLPLVDRLPTDCVLQSLVVGGEDRMLSYHAYVRPGGERVAEFTGRKLRTAPRRHGVSTYIEITDDNVVRRAGRLVLDRLDFAGVLKMDFKQDERDGRLYLLEINPRFSLWHHPATLAGVPVPELVYHDCIEPGSARTASVVRAGVRWLSAHADRRAMREHIASGELSLAGWIWQLATATVNEDFRLRDPRPGVTELLGMVTRRLGRAWHAFVPRPGV
jgi:predicted ATP-grasp superfamily ATP-dependent carboligase